MRATHCNTAQRTATHCNALQHTAPHCNTLHPYTHLECYLDRPVSRWGAASDSRGLVSSWGGVVRQDVYAHVVELRGV